MNMSRNETAKLSIAKVSLLLCLLSFSKIMPMNLSAGLLCKLGASALGAMTPKLLDKIASRYLADAEENIQAGAEEIEFVLNILREKGIPTDNIEVEATQRKERQGPKFFGAVRNGRPIIVRLEHFSPVAVQEMGMVRRFERGPDVIKYQVKFGELGVDDIAQADFIFMDLETALRYEKDLRGSYDPEDSRSLFDPRVMAHTTVKQQLDVWRGTIQHELEHIKQFEGYGLGNTEKISGGLGFLAFLPVAIAIPGGVAPTLMSGIGTSMSGIGTSAISTFLYSMMHRYYEKKADDAVEDDEATLFAARDEYAHLYYRQMLLGGAKKRDVVLFFPEDSRITSVLACIDSCADIWHPSPATRAKRFDERLAKLRARRGEPSVKPKGPEDNDEIPQLILQCLEGSSVRRRHVPEADETSVDG